MDTTKADKDSWTFSYFRASNSTIIPAAPTAISAVEFYTDLLNHQVSRGARGSVHCDNQPTFGAFVVDVGYKCSVPTIELQ